MLPCSRGRSAHRVDDQLCVTQFVEVVVLHLRHLCFHHPRVTSGRLRACGHALAAFDGVMGEARCARIEGFTAYARGSSLRSERAIARPEPEGAARPPSRKCARALRRSSLLVGIGRQCAHYKKEVGDPEAQGFGGTPRPSSGARCCDPSERGIIVTPDLRGYVTGSPGRHTRCFMRRRRFPSRSGNPGARAAPSVGCVLLVFAVGIPHQVWLTSRTPARLTGCRWFAPINSARRPHARDCFSGN